MFELVNEPNYIVTFSAASDTGVFSLTEWFQWDDDPKPIFPGSSRSLRASHFGYESAVLTPANFGSIHILVLLLHYFTSRFDCA
jgi:hypothetical protein